MAAQPDWRPRSYWRCIRIRNIERLVTWHVSLQFVPSLAWLAGQSFEQQREVLAQLEQAHEQPRAVKRAEVETEPDMATG